MGSVAVAMMIYLERIEGLFVVRCMACNNVAWVSNWMDVEHKECCV
jgi:hypothetical protein